MVGRTSRSVSSAYVRRAVGIRPARACIGELGTQAAPAPTTHPEIWVGRAAGCSDSLGVKSRVTVTEGGVRVAGRLWSNCCLALSCLLPSSRARRCFFVLKFQPPQPDSNKNVHTRQPTVNDASPRGPLEVFFLSHLRFAALRSRRPTAARAVFVAFLLLVLTGSRALRWPGRRAVLVQSPMGAPRVAQQVRPYFIKSYGPFPLVTGVTGWRLGPDSIRTS